MRWYWKTFSVRPELPQEFRMPEAQVAEFLNQNGLWAAYPVAHVVGVGDRIVVFYYSPKTLPDPKFIS